MCICVVESRGLVLMCVCVRVEHGLVLCSLPDTLQQVGCDRRLISPDYGSLDRFVRGHLP